MRSLLSSFSSKVLSLVRSCVWAVAFILTQTVLKEHVETLHGIVRLFIVRVAPFRRPLGIFSSTTFMVSAKQNDVVWLPLNQPKAYFTCESIFWLPDAFADGGGTKRAS